MHRINNIKIVSAQQAKIAYNYRSPTQHNKLYGDKIHYGLRLSLDICIQW